MIAGLRHVAPAGAPLTAPDLLRWAGLTLSGRDASETLRSAVSAKFGVRHCLLTSTGRAGMTLLLRALTRLAPSGRDEVVLPSYTCYSLAASVVRAGLRPRIVDISPATLDYSPECLNGADFTRVLAIVATNLYGLPNDLPAISEAARRHGAFVIDDAAQAMGASVGGRWSGTWGDAGLFSLDKGKNISAMDGGIVVTNSGQVASALAEEMKGLPSPGVGESGLGVIKALAYFLLLRPWLYWIPNGVPQLRLGETVFRPDFPLALPSPLLVGLGATMINRLDEFSRARVSKASALLDALKHLPGIQSVAPLAGAAPVYLRLPLLFADASERRRALDRLRAAGIGASASYPGSIADIPELREVVVGPPPRATGGRYVAQRILTLPTHAFVSDVDIRRTVDAIAACRVERSKGLAAR